MSPSSRPARPGPDRPFYIYKWFTGVDPPADGSIGVIAPNPALFFAVLQEVGPNLTPETFRDAAFALPGNVRRVGDQPAVPVVGRQGLLADDRLLGRR